LPNFSTVSDRGVSYKKRVPTVTIAGFLIVFGFRSWCVTGGKMKFAKLCS